MMSHLRHVGILRAAICAISVLAIAWALFGQINFFNDVPLLDFGIYRTAAASYLSGQPIYSAVEPLADTFRPGAIVYKMTPLYLLPFIAMDAWGISHDPRWYLIAIFVAALALIGFGFYIVCRKLLLKSLWVIWPTLATLLWWQPAHWSFYWTSAELWLVVLAMWSMILMPSKPVASGALIAVASLLKLYPVLLLLLPLCLGYWRVFLGFSVTSALLAVVSLVIFPWSDISFYLFKLLPILLREPVLDTLILPWRFHFGNFQWMIGFERMWWGVFVAPVVFKAITLGALLASAALMYRCKAVLRADMRGLLLAACLLHSLILIYLPNVFFGYFCWLILPAFYFLFLDKGKIYLKVLLVLLVGPMLLPEYWFGSLVENALEKMPEAQLGELVAQSGIWLAIVAFEPRLLTAILLNKLLPWMPWFFWLLSLVRICQLHRQAQLAPVCR